MDKYRAAPGLSGSQLGILAKSPCHFAYAQAVKREPTDAMMFGSLVHCMLLEPVAVSSRYMILPESLTRRAGKDYEQLLAMAGSRETVKYADWWEAEAMVRAVRGHSAASLVLADSLAEQEYHWVESLVPCKGKLDIVKPEAYVIADYKTTNDASPRSFRYKVLELGYLLQLCHYQIGYARSVGREDLPGVLIVAQETDAPYVVQVYSVPQAMLDEAHAKRRELLQLYAECTASGDWTRGYSSGIIDV